MPSGVGGESSRPVKGRPMWLSEHYTARGRLNAGREGSARQERMDDEQFAFNSLHEEYLTPQPRPLPVRSVRRNA